MTELKCTQKTGDSHRLHVGKAGKDVCPRDRLSAPAVITEVTSVNEFDGLLRQVACDCMEELNKTDARDGIQPHVIRAFTQKG